MSPLDVLRIAKKALTEFQNREVQLFELDANERSLTHKLAEILQQSFPDWNVDCEYNRLNDSLKVLPAGERTTSDDTNGISIYPDIIVHKRAKRSNLLVVEMKKKTNLRTENDEMKLRGLTQLEGNYGYALGLHVVVDCEARCIDSVRAYVNGNEDDELTRLITAPLEFGAELFSD